MSFDSADHNHQSGDEFAKDRQRDQFAGRNVFGESPDVVHTGTVATAFDLKDVHDRFDALTDDELKAIPIVPQGTRLQQGAAYVDLRGDRKEFTATGEMSAGPTNAYAPKDAVDYQLWNRLIGVRHPERTGQTE